MIYRPSAAWSSATLFPESSLELVLSVSLHLRASGVDGSARAQMQWQGAPPPCQHSRSPVSSLPFFIYLFFSHLRLRYIHGLEKYKFSDLYLSKALVQKPGLL